MRKKNANIYAPYCAKWIFLPIFSHFLLTFPHWFPFRKCFHELSILNGKAYHLVQIVCVYDDMVHLIYCCIVDGVFHFEVCVSCCYICVDNKYIRHRYIWQIYGGTQSVAGNARWSNIDTYMVAEYWIYLSYTLWSYWDDCWKNVMNVWSDFIRVAMINNFFFVW